MGRKMKYETWDDVYQAAKKAYNKMGGLPSSRKTRGNGYGCLVTASQKYFGGWNNFRRRFWRTYNKETDNKNKEFVEKVKEKSSDKRSLIFNATELKIMFKDQKLFEQFWKNKPNAIEEFKKIKKDMEKIVDKYYKDFK